MVIPHPPVRLMVQTLAFRPDTTLFCGAVVLYAMPDLKQELAHLGTLTDVMIKNRIDAGVQLCKEMELGISLSPVFATCM